MIAVKNKDNHLYINMTTWKGDDDLRENLDKLLFFMNTFDTFTVLSDMRGMPLPKALARRIFSEFLKKHKGMLDVKCKAWVLLTASALERGVVTAINWAVPTPYTLKTFSDKEKAEAFLIKCLDENVPNRADLVKRLATIRNPEQKPRRDARDTEAVTQALAVSRRLRKTEPDDV